MNTFQSRLPLAQQLTDRDHERRSAPGLLAALLDDESTRILFLNAGTALGRADREVPSLELSSPARLSAEILRLAREEAIYLGRTLADDDEMPAGTSVLSLALPEHMAREIGPDAGIWVNLMEAVDHLSIVQSGLFTQALAISNWHASHRFSPATGSETRSALAGWTREAVGEKHISFPRTDSAVIAAIRDADDRILLGANVRWTPRRFSLLAGFVEPGESFEAAVAREIYEESRARIVDPRYLGSQPWPFPASIMVGFTARLHPDQDPSTVEPDNDEIAELGWFTRDEVRARLDLLPGRMSIARAIIDTWLDGELD